MASRWKRLLMTVVLAAAGAAQTALPRRQEFEVASVKPTAIDDIKFRSGAVRLGSRVCGLLSTVAGWRMVDKVTEKLPNENQFAYWGWYWSKTLRLHREYNRLYPSGPLSRRVRILGGLVFLHVVICAWALSFFGK
jgi:hypothetical protein